MKRHLLVLLGLAFLAISVHARAKPANPLEVVTGFAAKETCSCAFVVAQTDAYCTAFGKPPGFDVALTIDRKPQTVTSSFGGVSRTARFRANAGCVLDALP